VFTLTIIQFKVQCSRQLVGWLKSKRRMWGLWPPASGALSASATQTLYPTYGNLRIYQLQHAETESAPNVVRLLSAETECPPKVPICPHSAPKTKPKFLRPLYHLPFTMLSWYVLSNVAYSKCTNWTSYGQFSVSYRHEFLASKQVTEFKMGQFNS